MKKYLLLCFLVCSVACVSPTGRAVEVGAGFGSYTRTLPIYGPQGAVGDNEPEFSLTDVHEDGARIAGRTLDLFGRLSVGEGTIEDGTRVVCNDLSSQAHKKHKPKRPKHDDDDGDDEDSGDDENNDEPTTSCSTIPQQKTTILTYTLGIRESKSLNELFGVGGNRLFLTGQAGLRAGVAFDLGEHEFEFGPDVEASLTYRVNDGKCYFGPSVGAWCPLWSDLPGGAAVLPRIGLVFGYRW